MKKSRFSLASTPVFASVAFTLIELLVVITIIAVLASLSIAAAGGVQLAAKKATAHNDLIQLVNAVTNYYTDYGQYPPPASTAPTTDYCYGPANLSSGYTNDLLMDVLRCPPNSTDQNIATLNPRGIKYLQVSDVKNSNAPRSGILPIASGGLKKGTWVDPWGQPYVVFIDGDYDGCITINKVYSSNVGTSGTVAIATGASCIGLYCNKKSSTPASHAYDKTLDLLSWQ